MIQRTDDRWNSVISDLQQFQLRMQISSLTKPCKDIR